MTACFNALELDKSDPDALLDAAEIQLLATGDEYLSYSEFLNLFSSGAKPPMEQVEVALAGAHERSKQMGSLYPFNFDGRGVSIDRAKDWQIYALLLLLSLRKAPFRDDKEWKRSDPLFDSLVACAFSFRWGKTLQFGWPPRGGPRPPKFPEALAWAATEMGLELRGAQQLPDHRADGGVDVIAWDPLPGGGTGAPVVLVQNTVQEEFWTKPSDVNPRLWRDWINFGNTPAIGFAVPFIVTQDDPHRPETVSDVLEFMDRKRLMQQASMAGLEALNFRGEFAEFVDKQLSKVRAGQLSPEAGPAPYVRMKKKPRVPAAS